MKTNYSLFNFAALQPGDLLTIIRFADKYQPSHTWIFASSHEWEAHTHRSSANKLVGIVHQCDANGIRAAWNVCDWNLAILRYPVCSAYDHDQTMILRNRFSVEILRGEKIINHGLLFAARWNNKTGMSALLF